MPKVTIDGQTIEVPAGTLVVEAAKPVGSHIPVFCYHPKMAPAGMCRMCLVQVGTPKMDPATKQPALDENGQPVINWMPKLQTGCTTVVSEGMVVHTTTSQVAEARRGILEFLLTSHPLDCPVCDKGGECPLQDHTLHYGPGNTRFYVESKFHNDRCRFRRSSCSTASAVSNAVAACAFKMKSRANRRSVWRTAGAV